MLIHDFIELDFETAWWKGMPSYTYNTMVYFERTMAFFFFFFNRHTKYYLNQINSLFGKKKSNSGS